MVSIYFNINEIIYSGTEEERKGISITIISMDVKVFIV